MDEQHIKTDSPVSESGPPVLEPISKKQWKKEVLTTVGDVPSKRGPGRPKKGEIVEKLKPGKRGRPVGDFTKARELCARMLVSEGDRMLNTLIKMALTDGHPNQIAALKMCLDRSLPLSYFENKEPGSAGGQGITINISGINAPQIQTSDDVIDVDSEQSSGT